ncbi:histidine phosphatase family protein [Lentilactobacillus farraginis]|uniref:histidine phosphatase family protein n=1 Tax=Lentilactobacillus farraginis TaxID=390841 RepID=UPI000A85D2E1|nr:histidine phosphatase family protein [Lentilactobacillus farraginis]
MKKIYFVRHGQTLLNQFRRMQGWVDSPLTKKGEQQAAAAGEKLKNIKFDLAISSDMMRAIHTLDIILENNQYADQTKREINKDVREIYFGSFEAIDSVTTWNMIGGPFGYFKQADLIKKYGLLKVRDFMHEADPFHYAETADQLKQRIQKAVTTIQTQLNNNQTALVVSHGTYLRNLATLFSENQIIREQPKNGSIMILDVTETPTVISYNQ